MKTNKNRKGFIELFFLMFFVFFMLFVFTCLRTMDVAENQMRRQQGLPEKEMITDRLSPVKEDHTKELEERVKELEKKLQEQKPN